MFKNKKTKFYLLMIYNYRSKRKKYLQQILRKKNIKKWKGGSMTIYNK